MAWIMFVSAIETAASHWSQTKETAVEKLRASKPDLEAILFEYGGSELIENVAELIVPYMGATKKFTEFVLEFLPSPPMNRLEGDRLSWETRDMKKT